MERSSVSSDNEGRREAARCPDIRGPLERQARRESSSQPSKANAGRRESRTGSCRAISIILSPIPDNRTTSPLLSLLLVLFFSFCVLHCAFESIMRPRSLLLALPLLVSAAPSSIDRENIPSPAPSYLPGSWALPRPWKLLRDWMVESIAYSPSNDHMHPLSRIPTVHKDSTTLRSIRAQYGNDVVLRFNASSSEDVLHLFSACDDLFLDVWDHGATWLDVRVSKDVVPSLLALLPRSLQHAHSPLMQSQELVRAIEESYQHSEHFPSSSFNDSLRSRGGSRERNVFFEQYRPWSVMVPWMRLMASMFPSHARLISVGKTYEDRDIFALRIGVHPTNAEQPQQPRKAILITAGIHAREWISTSTATYIANHLMTEYGKSKTVTRMLEQYDWIIVPSLNPDGYVYTWNSDRLWRKNRQDTPLNFCRGVDLDRSFGFMWNGDATTRNPCSENYAGESPFEGVEAAQLATWVRKETEEHNVRFVSLLDLHSYSQQVLYPYSFSCNEEPPTLENLEEMGEGLAKAIRAQGSVYSVVQACEGNVTPLANAAGGSLLDWIYHELSVKITYQFKLRDLGSWGFLLPKDYIVPVGEEILDAVMYLGGMLTVGNRRVQSETLSPSDLDQQKPIQAPS